MTIPVLLAARFPARFAEKLAARVRLIGPFAQPLDPDFVPEEARAAQVLMTMGTLKTNAALLDKLPVVKLVCCYGTGYEGVDLTETRRRGIAVTYSPEANASAVADLALGLLLAVNRQIVQADRYVREGRWMNKGGERMTQRPGLTGRKVGVLGLGAIGLKIARRVAAFEAEVAYHGRSRKAEAPYAYHETLISLAQWADVLMVAARADASNRHMVDADILKALGPEGIVVNIARGSIIDENALIGLLQAGELRGAGLDVFENEPVVPEALKQMNQVVLAPHIGGNTSDAHEAMQDLVIANLEAFLAGRPLVTPTPDG